MASSSRKQLARLSREASQGIISVRRASEVLGVSRPAASTALVRWADQGWLTRIRRGLYLILPVEADPSAPATVEDPWVLAMNVYEPCYVGGWSAAEHWELTEQLFRSTFVVTTANIRARDEVLLGSEFHLVRTTPSRLINTTAVWRGTERVPVSGPEKTIADGLADPTWVGGVAHLIQIIRTYDRDYPTNEAELLDRIAETGSGAAFKRLGFIVEELGLRWPTCVSEAQKQKTAGIVALDPGVKARGTIVSRWGIRANLSPRQWEED